MIRIGVVGAGYWGAKHLRVLHELQGSELYMVCDQDQAKLDEIKHYYPKVLTTSDYQEMLKSDVDAIVIATPVNSHFSLTKEALLAGKHVLVEKPLTSDVESAQVLVDLSEEKGLTLMVGHTYQYHPTVDFLKSFLSSGELGDLYYIDSARLNLGVFRTDVDVLWDLAPHDISIFLYLLGQDPIWVSARATAHVNPALAEVSYISLGFPDQVLAHTHVSWLDPCKVRKLTMVGSKRMVVFDEVAPFDQLRIVDKGASLSDNGNGSNAPVVEYRYGEVRAPFIPDTEPLKLECAHFLECVEQRKKPRSDGQEALRVISIIEAAHQSLANEGQRVNLPQIPRVQQPVTNSSNLLTPATASR